MYFDTSLKTSRREYSGLSSPGWAVWKGNYFSFSKYSFPGREVMETRREEIDPFEGFDDPTL
jgi:hypothetical protein